VVECAGLAILRVGEGKGSEGVDGGFENGNERRATGDLPPEPSLRGVR
jgi:hypothetical protein